MDATRSASSAEPDTNEAPAPPQIFISYSSKDQAMANEVERTLTEASITCYLASKENRTGLWPRKLFRALKNCRLLLLILSKSSNSESQYVPVEVQLAWVWSKYIHVFQIEDVEVSVDLCFLQLLQIQKACLNPPSHYPELVRRVGELLKLPVAPPVLQKLRLSKPSKVTAFLASIILPAVAIWAHLFTPAGWISYLVLFFVLLAPLLVYNLILPDFLRASAANRARTAWSKHGRFALVVIIVVLVVLPSITVFLGTVSVESKETKSRVTVFRDDSKPPLNRLQKLARDYDPFKDNVPKEVDFKRQKFVRLASWIARAPVTVRVDGLPDKCVELRPWDDKVRLQIPAPFLETPTFW